MNYRGKNVLVVDPDPRFREETGAFLKERGFAVRNASTREEAEHILEKTPTDLLLTEIMLETEDAGFILCYHAKKRQPSLKIMIITDLAARTGREFDLAEEDAKQWIHADAILNKEVRNEQLEQELVLLL